MSKENSYFTLIGPERRGSLIRKLGAGFLQPITEEMHRQFPYLTPTHLSILGVVGVSVGSLLAARHNSQEPLKEKDNSTLAYLTLLGFSSLLDGFDGSLARLIATENPDSIDLLFKGTILDSIADYLKEMVMFESKVVTAHKRQDKIGGFLAYLSVLTSPLSSLARAHTEASGVIVPEIGNNIIEFFGTRTGRTICSIIAIAYPRKGISLQPLLDAFISTGNIANVLKNLMNITDCAKEIRLSKGTRNKAMLRVKLHSVFAVCTAILSFATFRYLNRNRLQKCPVPGSLNTKTG